MKSTTVIQIFGGPNAGKSVLAADLFSLMKKSARFGSVELVQEFAKELVWQERFKELDDQRIVTVGQIQKTMPLNGRVDYLVTDSPLLVGLVYAGSQLDDVESLILEQTAKFGRVINIFVNRGNSPFESAGRIHDEVQSKEIDFKIKAMLESYGFEYSIIERDDVAHVLNLL